MIDRYLSLPTVLVLLLLLTHHQLALQPGVCDVVKSVHVMSCVQCECVVPLSISTLRYSLDLAQQLLVLVVYRIAHTAAIACMHTYCHVCIHA
jgi:hypothetical protein